MNLEFELVPNRDLPRDTAHDMWPSLRVSVDNELMLERDYVLGQDIRGYMFHVDVAVEDDFEIKVDSLTRGFQFNIDKIKIDGKTNRYPIETIVGGHHIKVMYGNNK